MFVDSARIFVRAGSGGNGCRSIYRDKYTRYGIPDGGDAGKGGDIIIRADQNLHTLLDFKHRFHFHALSGSHGSGNNRKGKDAADLVILVPVGTVVFDAKAGCILRDLEANGQEILVAKGGSGGKGNRHRNRDTEITEGYPGEERELVLDLKVIADVGVVGYPNCGKSTLLSVISSAHPKIAAYPFTTKSPVLGVVRHKDFSFVVADIPGLIEGSHRGRGLGDRFLRHIERTKIILHLIDMAGVEARNPIDDYKQINNELRLYSKEILEKPQILAANKMDLEGAEGNLRLFKKHIRKKIYPISALKKEGLEELIEAVIKRLQKNSN